MIIYRENLSKSKEKLLELIRTKENLQKLLDMGSIYKNQQWHILAANVIEKYISELQQKL